MMQKMESRNCPNCGAPSNSDKCEYCGALIPATQAESPSLLVSRSKSVELWNPTAAIWWSLLFLPLGPILHCLNWKTLREDEKAKKIQTFAIIICIIEIIWLFSPNESESLNIAWWVGELIVWGMWGWGWFVNAEKYITGKEQIKYVTEKYGTEYGRKSWLVPLAASFVIGFYEFGFYGLIEELIE